MDLNFVVSERLFLAGFCTSRRHEWRKPTINGRWAALSISFHVKMPGSPALPVKDKQVVYGVLC